MDRKWRVFTSKLAKVYDDFFKHPFTSELVFESFSRALKGALDGDCSEQGLELTKFICGDFKIEAFIHNPETNIFVYVCVSGLRGGYCLSLNNIYYKREDGVDFPRGGVWCRCAPLPELIERVKSLTER